MNKLQTQRYLHGQYFSSIIDAVSEAIYCVDQHGVCIFINQAALNLLGYSESKCTGSNMHDLVCHSSPEELFYKKEDCPLCKSLQNGNDYRGNAVFIRKDTSSLQVTYRVKPLMDNNIPQGASVIFSESGPVKAGEQEISRLRANQDAIINATPDLIWSIDREYRLITTNQAYQRVIKMLTGLEVREGDTALFEAFGPELISRWRSYYQRAMYGEEFSVSDQILSPLSNANEDVIISFRPMYNDQQLLIGAACSLKNVTEILRDRHLLERTRSELKKVLDCSLDMICTIDIAGTFVSVSAAARQILGYTAEELTGKSFLEFLIAGDKDMSAREALAVTMGGDTTNFQNRYRHKDGHIVPLVWSASWNEKEKLIYCVARDATEKVLAEQQLKLNEQRFRSLVQNGSDMIAILDAEGNYKYVSPTSLNILEISPESFIGKNAFDFIHPEDLPGIQEAFRALSNQKQIKMPLFRFRHNNGEWRWIETIVTDLLNDIAINGIVANSRDVTDRINASIELRLSEEKYKMLFQNSPLPNWIYDIKTMQILDVNETAVDHYGYSREEFLNMTIRDLRPPGELPGFLNAYEEKINDNQKLFRFGIYTHQKKNGSLLRAEINGYKFNYLGKDCMMVLIQDVTDREQALALLNENSEKLRTATEIAQLGYWQIDLMAGKLSWSDEVYEIWGVAQKKPPLDMDFFMKTMPFADREPFLQLQEVSLRGEKDLDCEHRVILPNGSIRWVHEKGRVVRFLNGSPAVFGGTVQDITTRKLLELSLAESNQRYDFVTKATSDMIWDWNIQHNTLYFADGFWQKFGCGQDGLTGGINDKLRYIHPDDLVRVKNEMDVVITGSAANWEAEFRYLNSSGTYSFLADRALIIRNHKGKAIRMVGAVQDITQQKAEEHRLKMLESVITQASDAALITEALPADQSGPRIIYSNKAFTDMTGYTFEEISGNTPLMLHGPKSDKKELDRLFHAIEQQVACEVTVINYKKNGEEFWNHFSVSPVMDELGKVTHWISIGRDVTERKNEELQKALLADISQAFSRPDELIPTLSGIMEQLVDFGNLSFGEIWLVDTDRSQISLSCKACGPVAVKAFYDLAEGIESFAVGEGLPGRIWQTGKTLTWHDTDPETYFVRSAAAISAGVKKAYGLPLINKGELIGALLLGLNSAEQTPPRFISLLENLGNHLAAEISRRQIEQELNRIFAFSPDIICIINTHGYFKKINPAACHLLGYSEKELMSLPVSDLIHPDDREMTGVNTGSIAGEQHTTYFENRFVTRSGKIKWFAWTQSSLPDEKMVFAIAKDITDKKHVEELLKKANELARIGSWEIDLHTGKILWSPMIYSMLELDESITPTHPGALDLCKAGPSRDMMEQALHNALTTGEPFDIEVQVITGSGRELWVRVIGESTMINGLCSGLYGSFQNIDERKRAQLAVSRTLNERNDILESIGDGFFAVDHKWTVTYWNTQAEKMLAGPKEQILGKNLWDVFSDSLNSVSYKKYNQAMSSRLAVRFEDWYEASGKWYGVSAYPSERGLSVFFKDITESKLSAIRLKELNESLMKQTSELERSEKQYSDLFHSSPQPMWVYDLETLRFLDVNESAMTHYGYSKKDFLSMTIRDIRPPEDLPLLESRIAQLKKDGAQTSRGNSRHQKSDGTVIEVEIFGNTLSYQGRPAEIIFSNDITERERYVKAIEMQNSKLREIAWIQSHILRAPIARIMGLISLVKDYKEVDPGLSEILAHLLTSTMELDVVVKDITDRSEQVRL